MESKVITTRKGKGNWVAKFTKNSHEIDMVVFDTRDSAVEAVKAASDAKEAQSKQWMPSNSQTQAYSYA